MAGFFNKIKSASTLQPSTAQTTKDVVPKKKDEIVPELTPLEKMLQNAGALREDGTDKFFGFENALFYSDLFRESVINYPSLSPSGTPNGSRPKVNVTIRPPMPAPPPQQQKKGISNKEAMKQRQAINNGQPAPGQPAIKPEDKPDTPEYKKKQAMLKGPILELAQENAVGYGMDECTFTGLKDIFLAVLQSSTRTGVLSPQRFLEIFKRDNEMFRNSMHQDAHEFYGLVLNDVIANVEANARRLQEQLDIKGNGELAQSVQNALGSALMNNMTGYRTPGTGWVHDIFEGVLTSETKCLTCETASQRDETFLDLSIDLEQHSSVTSCLRKFSAEEMLCERNKFHCDHCGGLQEAEKRMKVKRLPKVLTLHLKRFKYTEDYSRLQKLFHRVVYPYHLRMFNTTDDAEDPDRMYELYAVVVHIGGNAYHGHYVSIIKTKDRGWVLFDDEMVEPVDKHFVRNFFGDKPGMATAYVLFYQETTFEKVREEQEREGMEEVKLATQAANIAQDESLDKPDPAPLKRQVTTPVAMPEHESLATLAHAATATGVPLPTSPIVESPKIPEMPFIGAPGVSLTGKKATRIETKSRDDLKREKKEREAAEKAAEKAAKQAEKEKEKLREKQLREDDKKRREDHMQAMQARRNEQDELQKVLEASKKSAAVEEAARKKEEGGSSGFLDRSKRGSKSMSKRSFSFFKDRNSSLDTTINGDAPEKEKEKEKRTGRMSIGLGRKRSTPFLA
ncbi:hypothetical protein TGAM01_v209518 [Trichoderma gamsii]|uniref:ubiquitinyl hydrolase 1 n=1 Tax=Trichoderma gamsii TaxID=398673 RepID=A0A2P4ZBF1_9HYPO|nr:hypothetical protein TGAM01_v209518 [Trichoderma gamsii]PON21629.1 hypothetical protein TGAM01_v209518 [Trichoderma gamsii]